MKNANISFAPFVPFGVSATFFRSLKKKMRSSSVATKE